ncbi:MAG: CCA tRNA nucleotidyltransferase [Kiritimatiellia bacterium]|nr:CCA tRNA nucleotidyltransferase [Kiritimatiellia bacterium]
MTEIATKSLLAEGAKTIVLRLREAGFQALFAGGCVRDMILGREPKDFDVVTDAPPEKVLGLFPRAVAVGKAFGVVRVGVNRNTCPPEQWATGAKVDYYDVATYRKDGVYRDGRHPQSVAFTDERTDAARRDFTINAIFFDPIEGKLRDYVGGKEDIDNKIIRTVGKPAERFQDDHLRMLRAVRFAATLNFVIEQGTADSIKQQAALIGRVSAERIQQELSRILLESAQPGSALEMLSAFGLLQEIMPEAETMRGQEQPPQFHPEGDVWTHTILMLNALTRPSLRLAYAVLLHDIGKPVTAIKAPDRIRFNRHAEFGAAIATTILQRLRLPSADIKAVSHIIGNHMRFMDVRRMRKSTLRRLITADTFPDELELHRLDCVASHGDMQNYCFLADFKAKFEVEPVLPPPLIKGNDIIALGVSPGPDVGRLKKAAYDAQLESKFDGRNAALKWLKNKLGKR